MTHCVVTGGAPETWLTPWLERLEKSLADLQILSESAVAAGEKFDVITSNFEMQSQSLAEAGTLLAETQAALADMFDMLLSAPTDLEALSSNDQVSQMSSLNDVDATVFG